VRIGRRRRRRRGLRSPGGLGGGVVVVLRRRLRAKRAAQAAAQRGGVCAQLLRATCPRTILPEAGPALSLSRIVGQWGQASGRRWGHHPPGRGSSHCHGMGGLRTRPGTRSAPCKAGCTGLGRPPGTGPARRAALSHRGRPGSIGRGTPAGTPPRPPAAAAPLRLPRRCGRCAVGWLLAALGLGRWRRGEARHLPIVCWRKRVRRQPCRQQPLLPQLPPWQLPGDRRECFRLRPIRKGRMQASEGAKDNHGMEHFQHFSRT
jgi:hypothetical protein